MVYRDGVRSIDSKRHKKQEYAQEAKEDKVEYIARRIYFFVQVYRLSHK